MSRENYGPRRTIDFDSVSTRPGIQQPHYLAPQKPKLGLIESEEINFEKAYYFQKELNDILKKQIEQKDKEYCEVFVENKKLKNQIVELTAHVKSLEDTINEYKPLLERYRKKIQELKKHKENYLGSLVHEHSDFSHGDFDEMKTLDREEKQVPRFNTSNRTSEVLNSTLTSKMDSAAIFSEERKFMPKQYFPDPAITSDFFDSESTSQWLEQSIHLNENREVKPQTTRPIANHMTSVPKRTFNKREFPATQKEVKATMQSPSNNFVDQSKDIKAGSI